MTATNHGLMGIVIGAYLPLPIAIPIAFTSHFVMDALPHYGIPQKKRNSSKKYKFIVAIDTIFAFSLALLAGSLGKWRLFTVGWVAYSPDFMWVVSYLRHKRNLNLKPRYALMKFHKKIQWLERPWGAYVEIVVFVILLKLSLNALLK